jgi:DNA-binding transcriptional regulator LsrR (DeoR family)
MNKGEQTSREKLIEELYSIKYNREMDINEIVKQLYVKEGKTQKQMSIELHVSVGTINKWLTRAGVSSRKMCWI